jgi:hypothetical protein
VTQANNNSSSLSFTTVELLAEDENTHCVSVVDIALEKCDHKLETLTAEISSAIAEQIIFALNTDRPEWNVPEIVAQIAFELSNTIEPLLVAYLTVSDLPTEMINAIEVAPCRNFLSRTGGPKFAETTVSITKYGLSYLTNNKIQHPNADVVAPRSLNPIHRLTWSTLKSVTGRLPQKLTRQLVMLLAYVPRTTPKPAEPNRKIAIITLGLRVLELKNLDWVSKYRNKIVLDFFDFPGIPTTITENMPHPYDLSWAEKVLSSCQNQNNLNEIQRGFFSSYEEFKYLQQQVLNFANETTDWLRIAAFTAYKLKNQKVEVVITGHGLLIREKLLQIAIQRQNIPVISIAHSGIDDPCSYVSKYPADLLLGWGSIDEQILSDQHLDAINFKPGIMKETINDIKFEKVNNGSCVIVFLSPGQTGTTFVRVGPRQSSDAIKNLFQIIKENENLNFGLRFHPNYLDKALIDWVVENKPANSWVVVGPLTEALTESVFVLGVSLQMPTTAIIDLALHGVPVRHVLQGVKLRKNLSKFIEPVVLSDLEGMVDLLREMSSSSFAGESDKATRSLLSNVFAGNIEEIPVVATRNMINGNERLGVLQEEDDLNFVFWISSRFPRDVLRTEWIARPSFRKICLGCFKFPKYVATRSAQCLIVWFYSQVNSLMLSIKK